ncbi:MAG: Malate-2H(+)/Na(+)-lactate antiporter [Bacteroidetes bacterium ADurb.Bin037]|nr:MAG: Malate-2H(+)/Na(+)-lactate antiporter [Bacteroidetes bacterium ADurb.Bin037]HPW77705.1 Na+/H+ antiporter NhaC [Bacteroidales bacterium]HQB55488.1 Na+/H+ antiporter NhaC [Bacteroidales bacterium]
MKKPSLIVSLVPVILLVTIIFTFVRIFGDQVTAGPSQFTLLFVAIITFAIARFSYGLTWSDAEKSMLSHLKNTYPSILILISIGALTGSWMSSGIIPSMIYYGLKIIHPAIFLPLAFVVSSIISLVTGSSWSTVGTFGVALLGVGKIIGLPTPWLAGAIISGAYFGDKMSPLSDTTNLASSFCGVPLFTHIRYMLINTVPVCIICLVIYSIAGFRIPTENAVDVQTQLTALESTFNISIWLLLIPIITILLVVKKVSPFVTLFLSAIAGAVTAVFVQPQICQEIANGRLAAAITMISTHVSIETGDEILNNLTSTNGMAGMLNTVWLILCVIAYAGVMTASGMIHVITENLLKLMRNTLSTIASTLGTCIFFNMALGDQYMAIILPGNMFSESYKKQGFAPEVLSRTIEESATVTSVLIPWNTCGVAQSTVLNVATLTYLPYCFFNLITPLFSLFAAAIGYKIRKLTN